MPHAPQLLLSVAVSTHEPSHTLPLVQTATQLPAEHVSPSGHGLLQPPQLCGLVLVSRQAPEQRSSPAAHVAVHWPLTHAWPALHVLPQSPQLLLSL